MSWRHSLVSLACFAAVAAAAEAPKPPAEMTAADIVACVRGNLPRESMTQNVRMTSIDQKKIEHVLEAEIVWQRNPETQLSNVLLTFDAPPELRGASVLVLEKQPQNDMFMFQPTYGKTRRITAHAVQGKLMGTDFTLEDFERLHGMVATLEGKRRADAMVGDRKTFVTEAAPGDAGSEYARIVSRIDQDTCVPLEVELFTADGDAPAKRMTSDPKSVTKEKSGFLPREISMVDLRHETRTSIVIEKLEVDVPIDQKTFSAAELDRRGRFSSAPTR